MAKVKISMEKLIILMSRSESKCEYCGKDFSQDARHSTFSVDHATPKTRGGSNHIENLKAVCLACNASKGTKTVEEYRDMLRSRCALFTDSQYEILSGYGIKLPEPLQPKPYYFYYEFKKMANLVAR